MNSLPINRLNKKVTIGLAVAFLMALCLFAAVYHLFGGLFPDFALPVNPDTDRIIFETNSSAPGLSHFFGNEDIYIKNVDSLRLTHIYRYASDYASDEGPGSFSPQGDRIIFHDYHKDILFMINVDDPGQRQILTPVTTRGDVLYPLWSPDGQAISFETSGSIHLFDLTTGKLEKLTSNIGKYIGLPIWSPDGKRMAFTIYGLHKSTSHRSDDRIAVVDADGSNFQILTPEEPGRDPDWSPDSTQIVFEREGNVYVMMADGTESKALTQDGGKFPAWSPDGTQIAFERDGDIYVMKANGTEIKALTQDGAHLPVWSPDGKRLAYLSTANEKCEIMMNGSYFCTNELRVMNSDGSNIVVVWKKINTRVTGSFSWISKPNQ